VFVGYVLGPRAVIDECEAHGQAFVSKRLYTAMVKYFAPVFVIVILISEICRALGIGGWSI
jgi:NSS family neurotransmitter:Na+ symporter